MGLRKFTQLAQQFVPGPCQHRGRKRVVLPYAADLGYLSMTYGSCWDPVVAQVNLALERVNRPSADLSPPLAWWDKARLLLHGRLTVSARQLSMLQHVSLHPYNDTELFEVAWTDAIVDWTNGGYCRGARTRLRPDRVLVCSPSISTW